ncbi:MAG: hypothetical protein ACOCV7_03595 [Desulfonatronovibrionaceae bacterium]
MGMVAVLNAVKDQPEGAGRIEALIQAGVLQKLLLEKLFIRDKEEPGCSGTAQTGGLVCCAGKHIFGSQRLNRGNLFV